MISKETIKQLVEVLEQKHDAPFTLFINPANPSVNMLKYFHGATEVKIVGPNIATVLKKLT
jgi:hypothetical protein